MRAGDLNKRVTLQRAATTRDASKVAAKSWVPVATVWAAVEPLTGREYFAAAQVQSEVTARIRIRYRAGIVPAMRVLYGSRIFDILAAIDPGEKHVELQLMCKEVVVGGGS